MTGRSCSKISLTLASSELSVTIDPSLLLRKTPPMTFLWDYYRLNSLKHSLDYIYFPVYLSMIEVNDCSHLLKMDLEIYLC